MSALIAAGGVAAASLLGGLLQSMSGKRERELDREKFRIAQEDKQFGREIGAQRDIANQAGGLGQRQSNTLGGLINALQRTI